MGELQEVGAVDPAAREELIADLKQTDPSRWPLVIQEFRAAAAYRRRVEERASKDEQSTASHELAGTRRTSRDAESYSEHPEYSPAPQPMSPAVVAPDYRLALAPEPSLSNGRESGFSKGRPAIEKAGEAIAIPTDAPSLALRLAASQKDEPRGVRPSLPLPPEEGRGEGSLTKTTTALTPGPSPEGKRELLAASSDWHSHLAAAIRAMEASSTAGASGENDIALQARLRMLYLLAGRRDDAMRPLPAAPRATQEYWSSQIYGLATWMDTERTPDPARRAAETKRILSEALNQLGDAAPLAVRNLTFCTAVQYYGSFDAVKSPEFTPGQKVLLYAEVENFRTEPSPKGFHTAVKFNWQIFDSRGNRLGDFASAASEENSLTPKHEFFLTKWFYLPAPMSSGKYTLQFTVEDVLGHKVGQSSIEMTIK